MPFINVIKNHTRCFKAPDDWQNKNTPAERCHDLHIRDVQTPEGHFMISAWSFSTDELLALINGATLKVWVRGETMPVIALSVGALDGD